MNKKYFFNLSYLMCEKAKKTCYSALFVFALETGLRPGEIIGLTWDMVDLEKGTVTVNKSLEYRYSKGVWQAGPPKTITSFRTIPITNKAVEILEEEKKKQQEYRALLGSAYKSNGPDYVVCQADGTAYHPHSINRKVNGLLDDAGLPHCRIHDFRHAVASILFESGASISDVMIQLGHGQTSTTEKIYIHQRRVAKKENVQVLTKCFGL